MRVLIMTAACLAASALAACNPAFNWRETSLAGTPLQAMFPCKPDKNVRAVSIGGARVELHMAYCDAAGVTVAVGHARLDDPGQADNVLAQWRQATLAGMRAGESRQKAFPMERARVLQQAVSCEATGTSPDGTALVLRGAWFARDDAVYAALMYGRAIDPEAADTFFSSLRFR